MNCERPDRDVPELICGRPLPCPWHTVTIDAGADPPTVTIPATLPKAARPEVLGLLKEIALSVKPGSVERAGPERRAPRKRPARKRPVLMS